MGGIITYKASAGSGKTYTLVKEYIKYLFLERFNELDTQRQAHRRILAVTFTNKSATEMKERIVEALYKMSTGEQTDYIDYLLSIDDISKYLNRKSLQTTAKKLLAEILLDFSFFRVQTIDAFFQKVIREFARELGVNSEYALELDHSLIKEAAVERLLHSMEEKSDLLSWMVEFAKDEIDSQNNWNPKNSMNMLSELLFKEKYITGGESFNKGYEALKEYRQRLRKTITDFEKGCEERFGEMRRLVSDDVLDVVEGRVIKKGLMKESAFELSDAMWKVIDGKTDVDEWIPATKRKSADNAARAKIATIISCARRLKEFYDKGLRHYLTAKEVIGQLYITGILSELDENVKAVCRDNDTIIISSSTEFINKIIDNSTTPFIYEKIGTRTNHFLIDEFQDTSLLQWRNFVPLLQESIDSGYESLVVGDVKQSIYRWRNGDWSILHKGIKDVFGQMYHERILDTNYRSNANIIRFNNFIYPAMTGLLDKSDALRLETAGIYGDVRQEVSPKKMTQYGGFVKCRFIETDKLKKDEWQRVWIEKSIDDINELKSRGYGYGDMVCLVSNRNEATVVAECLANAGIPYFVESNKQLGGNIAVQFIVSLLRYIMQPNESLYRAELFVNYSIAVCGLDFDGLDLRYFGLADFNNSVEPWEKALFGDKYADLQRIKGYQLRKLVHNVDNLFNLSDSANQRNKPFLQPFFDLVEEFENSEGSDIKLFMEYWDKSGSATEIAMSKAVDAINIMTVHSSKGLEFKIVFIPLCDWKFEIHKGSSNYALVRFNEDVGSEHLFSMLPVDLKSHNALMSTDFSDEITKERQNTYLDVLNKLYVATTRAEYMLYINCTMNETTDNNSVSGYLNTVLESGSDDNPGIVKKEYGDCTEYVLGELVDSAEVKRIENESRQCEEKRKTESTGWHSVVDNGELTVNYETASVDDIEARTKMKYRYADRDFEAVERQKELSAVEYGTVMHRIFSEITTAKDVELAIDNAIRRGDVDHEKRKLILEYIRNAINDNRVSGWFGDEWQVMNEQEILCPDDIRRPDRIMVNGKKAVIVDYKFGAYEKYRNNQYIKQVRRYMDLLSEMGYEVEGWLWYIAENIIEKI